MGREIGSVLNGNVLNRLEPKTEDECEYAIAATNDMFTYHAWSPDQVEKGTIVREALKAVALAIITNVPASADRSAALRKIREARMDANSAITFDGRY